MLTRDPCGLRAAALYCGACISHSLDVAKSTVCLGIAHWAGRLISLVLKYLLRYAMFCVPSIHVGFGEATGKPPRSALECRAYEARYGSGGVKNLPSRALIL